MADLFEAAQLFEASAKLQGASTWLRCHAANQPTDPNTDGDLKWSGQFLSRLDPVHLSSGSSPAAHLAVQATAARPTYYASLLKLRHKLNEAGLSSSEELARFLRGLFEALESGGRSIGRLSKPEIELGGEFLRELSQGLLAQLDHNGLPSHYPYILPELAYHAHAS